MTPNIARTIQIFLPSGDPTGIRIAEITTSVLRVIEIPRTKLNDFFSMDEASQVGVYFLFGDDGKAYVGQSGDLKNRLTQHNKTKEFWNKAVVIFSLTNNLTQTHALFLEWLSIQQAKHADRFDLENGNQGSKPHAPAPLEADCRLFFDQITVLIGTLGYPIFKPLIDKKPKNEELFYCTRNDVDGKGLYTDEGFVVLKGSKGRAEVQSLYKDKIPKVRDELIASGDAVFDGDFLVLQKDVLFKTPSGASNFLICMSTNGWVEWKDKSGKTLDELKRKS